MSKRSRHERRGGQVRRAVAAGDLEALRGLAERSPRLAAQQLGAQLAAAPSDGADPLLLELAFDLASRLRRGGHADAARRLAAAGAPRSSRLRLEQALAAFALGDDDESARIAASDPEVMAVVGCLLDAARAAPPAAIPASSPGPLRSLHAAASAVSAAARGEHALARRWLKRVAPGQREALLTRELGAAIDLSARPHGKLASALAAMLVASPHIRANAVVAGAVVAELGEVAPERAIDAGVDLGLSADSMREVVLRTLAGRRAATETGGAGVSLEIVRRLGAEAFDDTTRGAAFIYEGFAWLEDDPERADSAFDQAIERGGDLVEALRGKLLLALSGGAVCEECGFRHPEEEEGGGEDAAAAADRLARVLGRTAAAAPLASAAAMVAAEEWISIDATKAARASIAAARKFAPESMAPAVDLLEARALESADPERAADLLDALLARDPGNREAWRMSIVIATRRGDRRRADDRIVQAADATRDPELLKRSRDVRIARGEIAPFEGFVPGVITAGELAAEIQRASAAGAAGEHPVSAALPSPLAPIAQRCRDALSPPARLAFDAARIVVAAQAYGKRAARSRFAEVASEWRSSSVDVTKLGAIMLLLDDGAALVEWAGSLGGHDDVGPALMGLIEAAVAAVEIPLAKKLLVLANHRLPRKDVFRAKALIARVERGGFAGSLFEKRPEAVARELNGLLAPHFRVPHDEGEDLDDDIDDEGPLGGVTLPSPVLAAFFETLDLPVEALDSLPPIRRAEFEAEAMDVIATERPGPAASKKIRALVARVVQAIRPRPLGSRAGAGSASVGGKR